MTFKLRYNQTEKPQSLDAKLAISVTANFVNNRTAEDSQSDEIAGLAYQYHQVSIFKFL